MFESAPEMIQWLAGQVRDAATTLNDGRAAVDSVPGAAFGDTDGGRSCASAIRGTVDAAGTTTGNLLQVLRSDVDGLIGVADSYRRTDEAGSERVGTIDVYSTHVTGGEPDQIAGVWDVVDQTSAGRPTVLAGDFNTDIDGNQSGERGDIFDPAAQRELERFEDLGFTDAGANAGPTSGDPERIDYIFTEGVTPVGTEVIDGGPSDHDGLVTDVVLPDNNPWDERN